MRTNRANPTTQRPNGRAQQPAAAREIGRTNNPTVGADDLAVSPYAGKVATLATMHGKERAITPPMREHLGLEVEVVAIDTDSFGTFSGETPRIGTPHETAIKKARAGMQASGLKLGIASEGTIGPDPILPFGTCDIETIVFVDDELGVVISETTRTLDTVAVSKVMKMDGGTREFDIHAFLESADFPNHGLIVKPYFKGITDVDVLNKAIDEAIAKDGQAVIESDFRAHFSPSRMKAIGECAEVLALRIKARCPVCTTPGWGKVSPLLGVPCEECGREVAGALRAGQEGCVRCEEKRIVGEVKTSVDAKWCEFCNP